eukprot:365253-Chlamydomonas_euryale.AAC.20
MEQWQQKWEIPAQAHTKRTAIQTSGHRKKVDHHVGSPLSCCTQHRHALYGSAPCATCSSMYSNMHTNNMQVCTDPTDLGKLGSEHSGDAADVNTALLQPV